MEIAVDQPEANQKRERWPNRLAFYFAAVGSAVGFGNVWRFPALVYEYGGGAFFIPYLLALFLVGVPILTLEIALGQYYETGDVNVFGTIHKRFRGVGVASIACGYMLVTYYSMLLSWVTNAFVDSLGSNNFWAQEEVTGSEAKEYFQNNIIGMNTLGDDLRPTRLVGKNVAYSFFTWLIIYLCIAFGIEWTGRITYITMGLPIFLLVVVLARAVTLEGSHIGIDEYIGDSNWDILTEKPEVWSKAVSQIFFSLGVTFGIMTAYGSHCERNEPAFTNSCVVAISNSLFSFIAGFAVFASLGHLAYTENLDSVNDLEYSSFGLIFGSWPVVLGTLNGGGHWIRALFLMLFLLGIDSAFSFMEGILTVLNDISFFKKIDKKYTSLGLVFSAWLLGLIYATDAGLVFLDTVDYYINFVMLLVGGFECFAAGWLYGLKDQVRELGEEIVLTYIGITFGSLWFGCAVWFEMSDPHGAFWGGVAGLVISYSIGMGYVIRLMHKKMEANLGKWTWKSMFYVLTLQNVVALRDDLSAVVGNIPIIWAYLIKHFIPPVVLVLFANLCSAENDAGEKVFGNYGGYAIAPYQILGVLVVVFALFLFLSSICKPELYDAFQSSDYPKSKVESSLQTELSQTTNATDEKATTNDEESTPYHNMD